MEYENVKPSRPVQVKTGFRRFIYGYKPPIDKEILAERRKDELRYPWDYTRDNLFRSRKPRRKVDKDDDASVDFPENDPMGLYRPREPRKHISLDDVVLPSESLEGRSTTDLLVNLKAKSKVLPQAHNTTEGIDYLVDDELSALVPRRTEPSEDVVYMPRHASSSTFSEDIDPLVAQKFKTSHRDLDDFSRMVENTFKPRPLVAFGKSRSTLPLRSTRSSWELAELTEDEVPRRRQLDVYKNAQFSQPKIEPRSRSRSRRAPSVPTSRRASVSSVHSVPKRSLADEEFEIVFPRELKPGPLPPCARRAQNRSTFQRSASLPPPSTPRVATTSTKGGLIDVGSALFRVVGDPIKPSYQSTYAKTASRAKEAAPPPPPFASPWASIPLRSAPAKRRYSFAFEDPETIKYFSAYVPKARVAASYGPVTVARPYVRRYTPVPRYPNTYQDDYNPVTITKGFRAASEPRRAPFTPSANLAVHQARACLGRIERELGMGSVSVDDAPYIDEPTVTTTYVPPVRSVARTGFIRGGVSPVTTRRSSYSAGVVSSRPPIIPRTTRRQEIEAKLETLVVPEPQSYPTSLTTLRSRTNDARGKMDQHRNLLDRYLPIPTGPPGDVPVEVEYKFKELADRMPQLQNRGRVPVDRATSLPPYRPLPAQSNKGASYNQYDSALRSTPFRPKMSDTRKRAREVLCKTKRDPHYFDY